MGKPLYISNPSKQNVVFHYRTEFTGAGGGGPAVAHIPSGGQVEIGHGWSLEEKERVVKQLLLSGARDAAEAHGTMGRFLGLLYRDGAPVDSDEIYMAHDAMVATQEQRSAAEATKSALAFDRGLNGQKRGKRVAKVTEVEVVQELAPYERATGNEVAFGLSVDPDGRQDIRLPA